MKTMMVAVVACFGLGLGATALSASPLGSASPLAVVSVQPILVASQNDKVRVKRNFNQQNLGYIPGHVWSPYGRVDCIGWWKKLPGGRLRCMGQLVPAD